MRAADLQGKTVLVPEGTVLRGAPGGGGLKRPLSARAEAVVVSFGLYGNAVREVGLTDIPGITPTVYANLADVVLLGSADGLDARDGAL